MTPPSGSQLCEKYKPCTNFDAHSSKERSKAVIFKGDPVMSSRLKGHVQPLKIEDMCRAQTAACFLLSCQQL